MSIVKVFFAEGFEEVEALTVVDLLRRADIQADMVSITQETYVKGARGITVETDEKFEETDFEKVDMLILPGGMPGTLHLGEHSGLIKKLKEFAGAGKYVAAICAAPSVLAKVGILEGKKATSYPSFQDKLEGALAVNEKVVVDGNIITSQGVGTSIEFAAKIIEVLISKGKSEEIKEAIVY